MAKKNVTFLYAYLDDAENNPKVCFELHDSERPKNSRPFFTKTLENFDKEETLSNLNAIDKIGFYTTLTVLHANKAKGWKHQAAVVFALESEKRFSIEVDKHANVALKHKGESYSFIPLKSYNVDDNVFDPVLSMRVGRLIVQALLD